MQVEQVREKMGDLEALKLELHHGMIDQEQYEDAIDLLIRKERDHRK
jgi:hypothetical protein